MFIDEDEIKRIRETYSIVTIAQRLGIDVNSSNMCSCIYTSHEDKNPSMGFHIPTNTFKCFSRDCQFSDSRKKSYDVIDLVMYERKYTFVEACEYITGNSYTSSNTTYSRNKSIKNDSYIKTHDSTKSNVIKQTDSNNKEHKEVKNFHNVYMSLLQNDYIDYNNYLPIERNIIIARYEDIECKVVKDSAALESKLINEYGKDILVEAGLYSKSNNFLFKNDYLLIPYFNKENQIHTIKARYTKEVKDGIIKHLNCNNRTLMLYGIHRLYNDCTLIVNDRQTEINHKDIKTVYICEGEIDALSILQVGKIAVACGGANNWNDSYTNELLHIPNIIIITDSDNVGSKAKSKIAKSFLKYRKATKTIDIKKYIDCKDVNEVLTH